MNRQLKERVWRRDGVRCRYCGKQLRIPPRGEPSHREDTATVDHVIPIANGGRSRASNLVTACLNCNRAKGSRPALDFRTDFTPARSRTSRDAGSPDTNGAASGRAAPEGIL